MIMELADETPHAYVPFLPAVKSKQPHYDTVFWVQSYTFSAYPPNFSPFFSHKYLANQNFFLNFAPVCGLITPASCLNPWVHTSTKATMLFATS